MLLLLVLFRTEEVFLVRMKYSQVLQTADWWPATWQPYYLRYVTVLVTPFHCVSTSLHCHGICCIWLGSVHLQKITSSEHCTQPEVLCLIGHVLHNTHVYKHSMCVHIQRCAHAHTRTHTHTHTQREAQTHISLPPSLLSSKPHTQTHTLTQSYTQTHSLFLSLPPLSKQIQPATISALSSPNVSAMAHGLGHNRMLSLSLSLSESPPNKKSWAKQTSTLSSSKIFGSGIRAGTPEDALSLTLPPSLFLSLSPSPALGIELNFILRMTVLGRGLIFQPVL